MWRIWNFFVLFLLVASLLAAHRSLNPTLIRITLLTHFFDSFLIGCRLSAALSGFISLLFPMRGVVLILCDSFVLIFISLSMPSHIVYIFALYFNFECLFATSFFFFIFKFLLYTILLRMRTISEITWAALFYRIYKMCQKYLVILNDFNWPSGTIWTLTLKEPKQLEQKIFLFHFLKNVDQFMWYAREPTFLLFVK